LAGKVKWDKEKTGNIKHDKIIQYFPQFDPMGKISPQGVTLFPSWNVHPFFRPHALYYLEKWWGKQMLSPLGANFTHPRGQVHHWELTSPLKTGLSFLTSLQICRLLHQKVVWGSLKWSG
jgi:hypothetical protein